MKSLNSICKSILIEGQDTIPFLNNLLISDLSSWPRHEFIASAICNPKGRILCSLWIKIAENNKVIIIFPKNYPELVDFLKMRMFRLKAKIEEINCHFCFDKDSIIELSKIECEEQITEIEYQLQMHHLDLPWIDSINSEKFIPQHLNLDQHKDIMSFTKGCYPGQEIIARMKFLGKIKKRMQLIHSKNIIDFEKHTHNDMVSEPVLNPRTQKFEAQVICKLPEFQT